MVHCRTTAEELKRPLDLSITSLGSASLKLLPPFPEKAKKSTLQCVIV